MGGGRKRRGTVGSVEHENRSPKVGPTCKPSKARRAWSTSPPTNEKSVQNWRYCNYLELKY